MVSTGRSTTTPAKLTRPGAGALTTAPAPARRSTPRWPLSHGRSGGSKPRTTAGLGASGQAQPRAGAARAGTARAPRVEAPPPAVDLGPEANAVAAPMAAARTAAWTENAAEGRGGAVDARDWASATASSSGSTGNRVMVSAWGPGPRRNRRPGRHVDNPTEAPGFALQDTAVGAPSAPRSTPARRPERVHRAGPAVVH